MNRRREVDERDDAPVRGETAASGQHELIFFNFENAPKGPTTDTVMEIDRFA
jgi:hypothetical protein